MMRKAVRLSSTIRNRIVSHAAKGYLRLLGVRFGQHLRIASFPICRRHPLATIQLGDNVSINNRLCENLAGVFHPTILVANTPSARLTVGSNVGISGA